MSKKAKTKSKSERRHGPDGVKRLPAAYESMEQCVAATGIPKDLLTEAKAQGCEAFKGHRIWLEPLLKFIGPKVQFKGESGQTQIGARKELDLVRAEREKIKLLRESGKMILLDEVKQGTETALSELFGTLDRIFCSELPPDLVGNSEVQMRDKLRRELDAARVEVASRLTALSEAQKETEEDDE